MKNVLTDSFGRRHTDLRISLIDKCNLRCTYCMPAEGVPWLPQAELLSVSEIVRLGRIALQAGVRTVRLTGGEPTLRRELPQIVQELADLRDGEHRLRLAMTTNALSLDKQAQVLADLGLERVNISLDTLRPGQFHLMTRRDRLADVLRGVDAAVAAGLHPVKINCVVQRGHNDSELADLVLWAGEIGVQMRFIEQMPLDAGHTWTREAMITADDMLAQLREQFDLAPVPGRGSAPAEQFIVDGGPQRVGIVASVTRPFCGACDRIRLTADGQLRNCLFSQRETDLRGPLREGASDAELAQLMGFEVARKLPGHAINDPSFLQPARPMSAIGG